MGWTCWWNVDEDCGILEFGGKIFHEKSTWKTKKEKGECTEVMIS